METGKVSVIIPCYKQAEYLSETLDSVMAQTFQNWECVIVDDGSPDNTKEVAEGFLKKDSRFNYIRQENKGLSSARNTGVSNSKGEYILPLDSDDLILPTYIEKAVNYFTQFPETKLVYCKAELFGGVNHEWELKKYNYDTFIWNNCIFCSAMFKRTDYNSTNGYNPNMKNGFEDWDFWLSLLKEDDVVHQINEILFRYRIKSTSMMIELSKKHAEEMYIQIYKNHKDIYAPFMEEYQNRIIINRELASELHFIESEVKRLRSTYAYRLGKFLLRPLSWFRK